MVGLFFHYDPLMVEIEVDRGAQVGVAGQAEKLLHPLLFLRHIEQVADALFFGAAGAADAVGVMFVVAGDVVVDDGVHVRDVDAAGRHVGGHEDGQFAVPEVLHDLVALFLGEVAVEAVHREAEAGQLVGQRGRIELGITEDHDPLVTLADDDLGQVGELVAAGGLQHVLGDLGLALLLGLDGDLLGVVLVQPADVHDLAADGGREHGQVFAGLHQLDDVADILIEAHVQHLVGFVQHDLGDVGEVDAVVFVMVHQAAGGGDHDLAPLCKASGLLFHVGATVNAGDCNARHKGREGGQLVGDLLGQAFMGLSLGSVLLLAALGLAITYGLLGVINMAHGEMLMIGAYSCWLVQQALAQLAPQWLAFYPLVALPVAFLVTAGIGMALERTIIRHLYGRPLETLLATWGISLMLIQLVRMLFGAQNVEVANPAWLSGGVQVLPNLILPWNRLAVLAFVLLVLCFTWLILNRTRLGMNVRAVTQNRAMAACCGVPTGRVDMLAFGLGSGIAGLGGVALSQLGNVGPELGQGYIIDSFLVVVLGGVGQLAGSVAAAFGLGIFNKILEPQMGAVLGKILILVMIILFIQKRPQGLFALKGRVID